MKINKAKPFPLVSEQCKAQPPVSIGCWGTITGSMSTCFVIDDLPCKKESKEEPMNKTDSQISRDYLNNRLNDACYAKRDELAKLYHIHDNTNPKSYKDLIDWIKNDKFKLSKHAKHIDDVIAEDGAWYGSFLDGIEWTGAGFTQDYDGYSAAEKEAHKQRTKAKDVIMTGDATAGLAALQAFEAWLPTPATPAN